MPEIPVAVAFDSGSVHHHGLRYRAFGQSAVRAAYLYQDGLFEQSGHRANLTDWTT
jgi:hypothetical protein